MIDPLQDPQAYYDTLSLQARQVWDRQQRFLDAYAQLGKLSLSAAASDTNINTVQFWQSTDSYMFKKRLQQAHDIYVEAWEQEMDQRLKEPKGNRGSDILLMFKLKAEAPEKYREEVKVLGVSAPLQMLDKLKELAAKDMKARELEGESVEGEYKEIE